MDQMTAPVGFPNPEPDARIAFHDSLPSQEETEAPDERRPGENHPEGDPPPVITGGTRMLAEPA